MTDFPARRYRVVYTGIYFTHTCCKSNSRRPVGVHILDRSKLITTKEEKDPGNDNIPATPCISLLGKCIYNKLNITRFAMKPVA